MRAALVHDEVEAALVTNVAVARPHADELVDSTRHTGCRAGEQLASGPINCAIVLVRADIGVAIRAGKAKPLIGDVFGAGPALRDPVEHCLSNGVAAQRHTEVTGDRIRIVARHRRRVAISDGERCFEKSFCLTRAMCMHAGNPHPPGRSFRTIDLRPDAHYLRSAHPSELKPRTEPDPKKSELVALEKECEPAETLFVADAMTGQDAVKSATSFGESVRLTGHVLTKLDGDARGGAALSITAVTGVPIKFVGVGEKVEELEAFHPDRMASRILGMGDVLSLIERAEKTFEEEEAVALAKKMQRDELTLEDFRSQLRQMKRMGSIQELMSFLPGASQMPAEIDEGELMRFEAILDSMTVHERSHPQVVNGSRRRRIARGSGTAVSDVNRLLKRFAEARKMVKKISRIQKGGKGSSKKLARMLGGLGR